MSGPAPTSDVQPEARHAGGVPPAGQRSLRQQSVDVLRIVGPPLAVGIAVLVTVSTLVGLAVVHSPLDGWDVRLSEAIAGRRRPLLDTLTRVSTWPADTVTVAVGSVLTVVVLARATRHWVAPVFLSVALAGEKTTFLASSLIVDRPRPPVPTLGQVHTTTGWPSGHVGAAIALYGGLALLAVHYRWPRPAPLRALLAGAATVIVAGVAFSRWYRGMHHVSDIVAGLVLGLTWLALASRIALERRPGP